MTDNKTELEKAKASLQAAIESEDLELIAEAMKAYTGTVNSDPSMNDLDLDILDAAVERLSKILPKDSDLKNELVDYDKIDKNIKNEEFLIKALQDRGTARMKLQIQTEKLQEAKGLGNETTIGKSKEKLRETLEEYKQAIEEHDRYGKANALTVLNDAGALTLLKDAEDALEPDKKVSHSGDTGKPSSSQTDKKRRRSVDFKSLSQAVGKVARAFSGPLGLRRSRDSSSKKP